MNDTKWREVLITICRRGVWFQLQLVGWNDDAFSPLTAPPHPGFFEKAQEGAVDIMIGGGFHFRQIWRLRCPTIVPGRLVRSIYDRPQDLAGLLEALHSFGRLPITQTQDYLEICGYDQSLKDHDG